MDRDFGTLGVKVLDSVVYSPGMFSKPPGPLAGAVISLNPESRARRVGGSVATTIAFAPYSARCLCLGC